jgi:hypothetical protein
MTVYERGHDNEPNYVRYLASITKTARECQTAGGGIVMKVGIEGRVVAGPKGGQGTVTLPIRVAVAKQMGGSGALFTKLYKVPVNVTPPEYRGDYAQVFDQITVPVGPDDRDLITYVGFDEGEKK